MADGMHLAEFNIGILRHDRDDPRTVSTLSVWEDTESLERFVWTTVHKQFYDRKDEWYDPAAQGLRLVMWRVPRGHRPDVAEAGARLAHLARHGDTEHAFGWSGLADATLWKAAQCGAAA